MEGTPNQYKLIKINKTLPSGQNKTLKSRRCQLPTDLELGIFTEFYLIPLSDYLMVVVHFAIETQCLNIIGGRDGVTAIPAPGNDPNDPK